MNRIEALKIGKIIADRWWHHNRSMILAKQKIDQQKEWRNTVNGRINS